VSLTAPTTLGPGGVLHGRHLALDGLRALAVGLVVFHHFAGYFVDSRWDRFALLRDPGSMGVRLFFVLSGYLITGILADARARAEAQGHSCWRVWWAFGVRRALRIFPLAYLALAVAWVIGVPEMREFPWVFLAYLTNLKAAIDGSTVVAMPILGHFWSLAVEEHFYLFWPVILLVVPLRDRLRSIALVIALAIAARIVSADVLGPGPTYWLTWCRLDALAVGGLVALLQPRAGRMAVAAAAVLIVATLLPEQTGAWAGASELAAVMLDGAIVIAVAQGWGARWLTWRPLVYLGTISYGIYVWHHMMPFFFASAGITLPGRGMALLAILTPPSILLAVLSWHLYERPINDLRNAVAYVPERPRSVAARLAVTRAAEH
jgi:peptidoglycan/LPS O-acetylase OafA/YrhL